VHDYQAIYQEFQPKIFRYLCHLCGESEAHDLTQVVFLKVSQTLNSFRGDASISTWIYRIATNTAHDHTRHAYADACEINGNVEDISDSDLSGADEEYARSEMNACIRGIVDELPEHYRRVLVLSDFEELSNQEIADILELSLDSVKIRLHRARRKLREALQCQCNMYHDKRNVLSCDRKPAR